MRNISTLTALILALVASKLHTQENSTHKLDSLIQEEQQNIESLLLSTTQMFTEEDCMLKQALYCLESLEDLFAIDISQLPTASSLTRAVNPTTTGKNAITTNRNSTLSPTTPSLRVTTDSNALKNKSVGSTQLAGSLN